MIFTTVFAGLLAATTFSSTALALPTPATNETNVIDERDLQMLERAGVAKVYSKCTSANTVALTFDDGPYIYNKQIVDTLDAAGIKGTFFWNGNNYECIYDSASVTRVKYAFSKGHQVASHTWSHADLSASSESKIKSELSKIDTALLKILGVKPAFMRPPYGNVNALAKQVVGANGQSMVLWDFDSEDSIGASVAESEKLYRDIVNEKPSNILALNHETYSTTAKTVLPYAIKTLKGKGYKFATVAQCLGNKNPYLIKQAAGKKDSTWHC